MVIGFTAFLFALVLSLAAQQIPAIGKIGADIRCLAGIPAAGSTCVAERIAALDAQRRAVEEERERLRSAITGQSFVFAQGPQLKDGVSLVVGTLYRDAAAQRGLIRSFCWAIKDSGGLDPRVGLAVKRDDGHVEEVSVGVAELAVLELSASDVDDARALCPFPQVP